MFFFDKSFNCCGLFMSNLQVIPGLSLHSHYVTWKWMFIISVYCLSWMILKYLACRYWIFLYSGLGIRKQMTCTALCIIRSDTWNNFFNNRERSWLSQISDRQGLRSALSCQLVGAYLQGCQDVSTNHPSPPPRHENRPGFTRSQYIQIFIREHNNGLYTSTFRNKEVVNV